MGGIDGFEGRLEFEIGIVVLEPKHFDAGEFGEEGGEVRNAEISLDTENLHSISHLAGSFLLLLLINGTSRYRSTHTLLCDDLQLLQIGTHSSESESLPNIHVDESVPESDEAG